MSRLTADDLGAWRRLSAAAVEPNPFLDPGFLEVAARQLADEEIFLLVDEDGREWNGCLAVKATRAANRILALSTWRHHYSYLGTPLADGGRLERFAGALARSVLAGEHGRFLALRQIEDGPVLAAIREAATAHSVASIFEQRTQRAVLRYEPGVEFGERVKSSRRKKLERQRRRFEKELSGDLTTIKRDKLEPTVREFLDLELASWKGKTGTALASQPDSRDFFVEMCRRLHPSEQVVFRSLEGDGRTFAMTCVLRAGGVEFGFKTAYDEDFGSYSPGLLHLVDVLAGEEPGRRMMDSCADTENETLNSLYPDRRTLVTLTLGPQGRLGDLVGAGLRATYSPRGRELAAKLGELSSNARALLDSRRRGGPA